MKRPVPLRRKALFVAKNVAILAVASTVIVADAVYDRAHFAIRRRLAERRRAVGVKKIISQQGG